VSRERQLVEAMVETAYALVDGVDDVGFLHPVAVRCVWLLDVAAAGAVLVDTEGALHATAATSENARLLQLFELQTGAGPCTDAFRGGTPVVNADLAANAVRWPRFAETALATGFAAVHALPLRRRESVMGALSLFSAEPRILTEDDVRAGQALADVAAIGILARRDAAEAEVRAARLQGALNSRIVIEQAKGVLAERRRISADAAFALLRDHARNHNLRLAEVAREVASSPVAAAEASRGTAGPPATGPEF
jgi:hypothetical protein